jgi:hypothetical protein
MKLRTMPQVPLERRCRPQDQHRNRRLDTMQEKAMMDRVRLIRIIASDDTAPAPIELVGQAIRPG